MAIVRTFRSRKSRAIKSLIAILGEENVSENPAVRAGYRGVNYGYMLPLGQWT